MRKNRLTPLIAAAALSASAVAVAQTSPSAQPRAQGSSAGASSPAAGQSMEKLQKAAQHLRESIQAMAQKRPGPERDQAIDQAHEALLETRSAMVALPPDMQRPGALPEVDRTAPSQRRRGAVSDAEYDRSVTQLMRAADSLRQSIQAMAQQPAGDRRNQAMDQARQALRDTQVAMVRAYDPSVASASRNADTRTSGAGGADQQSSAGQRIRADRN